MFPGAVQLASKVYYHGSLGPEAHRRRLCLLPGEENSIPGVSGSIHELFNPCDVFYNSLELQRETGLLWLNDRLNRTYHMVKLSLI